MRAGPVATYGRSTGPLCGAQPGRCGRSAGRNADEPRRHRARPARARCRPTAAPRRRSQRRRRARRSTRPHARVARRASSAPPGSPRPAPLARRRAARATRPGPARSRSAPGRASRRCRAAPAGSSVNETATLSPIPSTAQPSWGRPSTRIPATFKPSTNTSFGHLITAPGRDGGVTRSTVAATATPAISDSSCGGSRTTSEHSSAVFGGALQVRPWRPRPADCSAAVTRVPSGPPAAASSRARELVESVSRRCTRGVPSLTVRTGATRS